MEKKNRTRQKIKLFSICDRRQRFSHARIGAVWGNGGGKRTLFCKDNRLSTAIPHDFQPLTDIDARMGEFRMGVFFFLFSFSF